MGWKERLLARCTPEQPTDEQWKEAKEEHKRQKAAKAASEAAPEPVVEEAAPVQKKKKKKAAEVGESSAAAGESSAAGAGAAPPAPAPSPAPAPAPAAAEPAAASPLGIMAGSAKKRKTPATPNTPASTVAEVTAITKAIKKLGKASNTELRTLIEPLGPAKKKGKTLSETDFKTLWTAHQKRAEEFMAQAEAAYSAVPADRLPPAQKEAIIAGYQEKLALALEPADDVYAACMAKHRAAHPPKAPPTPKAPMINQDKAAECLALFARNGYVHSRSTPGPRARSHAPRCSLGPPLSHAPPLPRARPAAHPHPRAQLERPQGRRFEGMRDRDSQAPRPPEARLGCVRRRTPLVALLAAHLYSSLPTLRDPTAERARLPLPVSLPPAVVAPVIEPGPPPPPATSPSLLLAQSRRKCQWEQEPRQGRSRRRAGRCRLHGRQAGQAGHRGRRT